MRIETPGFIDKLRHFAAVYVYLLQPLFQHLAGQDRLAGDFVGFPDAPFTAS